MIYDMKNNIRSVFNINLFLDILPEHVPFPFSFLFFILGGFDLDVIFLIVETFRVETFRVSQNMHGETDLSARCELSGQVQICMAILIFPRGANSPGKAENALQY